MADINISDLKIAGSDLFNDSENYLQDLSEEEVNFQGGGTWTLAYASSEACGMAIASGIAWITTRL
jgi:hypothetical protein